MAERLKATFFAFKKREPGGTLLRATIAFVIIAIVLIGAFVALFWSSLLPAITWYGQVLEGASRGDTTTAAENIPSGFFTLVGALLLWCFPFYILCAAYEAACLRWMVHGESGGFMGLTLGAPTWRVWFCYWMWFLLNIAFSIVMSILMGVVVGVLTVSSGGDPTAATSGLLGFYVIQYAVMAYFAIRLAPGAAASIARRKWAFFDAWAVTRGRFVELLGSFALLYLLYVAASIGIAAVWFATVLGPAAPDLSAAVGDPSRFQQVMMDVMQAYIASLTNPQTWAVIGVLQLVGTIVAVVFYVATYGVNARAAQAALEEGKIKPAEG